MSLFPPDVDFDRYRDIRDEQVRQFVESMPALRDYYAPLPDNGPDCDGCGDPTGPGYRSNGHIILCERCSNDHGRRM